MKSFHTILFISSILLCISCKKDITEKELFTGTVNLVNAISSNDAEIKMNFTGGQFIYAEARGLGYFNYDGKYANGALTYAIPTNRSFPLVVTLATDTVKPLFNETLNLDNGDSYTLFTTGYAYAPATLLVKDNLIERADSTGIRVVNLSPNSKMINVKVYWNDFSYQFNNLAYKDITSFLAFPNNISEPFYMVEARDAVTDELYFELFLDEVTRQKNITIIVRGLVYGDPYFEVVRLNH
jgi:hypothetical protein